MPVNRIAALCALVLALAACGPGTSNAPEGNAAATRDPAPATATPAAAPAAPAVESPELAARLKTADLHKGKILFLQCRACHSIVPEAESGKIGPTLYGVIGRKAGSVPDFAYSQAVASSGITWTADKIDGWLQRPSEFLPGNKMVFVGIQDPQDRASIIAFIQDESSKTPAAP
jgi:cytochrome c